MKYALYGCRFMGYAPENFWTHASDEAKELVLSCLKDLDGDKILDCHVHLLSTGPENKNGCYLHDNWYDECCHPKSAIKRRGIMLALGKDIEEAEIDEVYMEMLTNCFAHFLPPEQRDSAPKVSLLGLDEWHDDKGNARPELTTMYINNHWLEYVVTKTDVEKRQQIFRMTPSIHPYKPTAVEELTYWHSRGARQIKWLPNAQGIDPLSEKCDPFYAEMKRLGMFLLSHTGLEHVLDEAGANIQNLGNPLRLRRALDAGVNVIAAHCASVGYYNDIDKPPQENGRYPQVQSMKLLFRLMGEYDNLYTDISGSTSLTRTALTHKALQASQFHDRMIFATDFPLPAIQLVVWLFCLTIAHDLVPPSCVKLLREIYYYNPVLSDFVKKRIMRWKDKNGVVHRFSNKVFQQADLVYKDNWQSTPRKRAVESQKLSIQRNTS